MLPFPHKPAAHVSFQGQTPGPAAFWGPLMQVQREFPYLKTHITVQLRSCPLPSTGSEEVINLQWNNILKGNCQENKLTDSMSAFQATNVLHEITL